MMVSASKGQQAMKTPSKAGAMVRTKLIFRQQALYGHKALTQNIYPRHPDVMTVGQVIEFSQEISQVKGGKICTGIWGDHKVNVVMQRSMVDFLMRDAHEQHHVLQLIDIAIRNGLHRC